MKITVIWDMTQCSLVECSVIAFITVTTVAAKVLIMVEWNLLLTHQFVLIWICFFAVAEDVRTVCSE
jgi:hypothetical protein